MKKITAFRTIALAVCALALTGTAGVASASATTARPNLTVCHYCGGS